METYYRSYLQIHLQAVKHNLEECRKRIGDALLLAVVKTNAYGHGAVTISRHIEKQVDYFAVACLSEAIELRDGGIKKPILILGYTSPCEYEELIKRQVTATIYSYEAAKKLSEQAAQMGQDALLHIAVDTGMGRIGFQVNEEEADEVARIAELSHLKLTGMFTHFAKADEKDKTFTAKQEALFAQFAKLLEERGVQIPLKHICNSAGIMDFDAYRYGMVRSGIITYGLLPSEEVLAERMDLIPAMEWKAHVVHLKELPAGRGISYGGTYVTDRAMRIATVSVGYGDGYPRSLSNKGRVLIRGKYAPILGRVCMDQMMVDVSEIPEAELEDTVTLIGRDGELCITAEELGELSGRFNYELVCDISERVKRIFDCK